MFHPMVVLNGTGTITYTALLTLLQYNKQESYEGSEQPEHLQTCCDLYLMNCTENPKSKSLYQLNGVLHCLSFYTCRGHIRELEKKSLVSVEDDTKASFLLVVQNKRTNKKNDESHDATQYGAVVSGS